MGKNNVLYDRNHVGYDKSIGAKKLYVDGNLPAGTVNSPYEGRLQIHNNIGACSVEVLSGQDQLPDGANVYVDNTTYQVVVAWPAVNPTPVQLINPSFETGDTSGWTMQTVGGSGTLVASSDYKDVGMYSAYWAGGKGLGSEGGIECLAFNDAKGPVIPGQVVTAKLRVMYNPGGGTPKGSRGQAKLAWYRSNDTLISMSDGFLIKTRKYNGKWTDTVVSDRAVPEAAYVKLVAWVTATGAGHTYFDNASWNLPNNVGQTEPVHINLVLKVMDSIGREYIWDGSLDIYNSYSSLVLEDIPLCYWKLDEISGTVMTDSSGNGHHGILNPKAGVTLGDSPLRLDASGSIGNTSKTSSPAAYLKMSDTGLSNGGSYYNFTYECIVLKTSSDPAGIYYAMGIDDDGQTYGPRIFYRYGTGSSRLTMNDRGYELNSPKDNIGKIVHFVFVMTDGNLPTRRSELYENGVKVATASGQSVTVFNYVGTSRFVISGCFSNGNLRYLTGKMSDVAIYTNALSPERIALHAKAAGLYDGS